MSLSEAALALVKALQIPVAVLSVLTSGIWPEQTNLHNNTEYDYIIVGGGTAGCVLATRLAQNAGNKVLLLEAGGDPTVSAMLAGLFVLLPKSEVDYDFKSSFDPYAARSQGNYTKLTAGKMLGGSSSLNHFLGLRGAKFDFDTWENLGNKGWNYDSVLPYFKKSESVRDDEIIQAYPEYHNTTGPLGMTRETSSDATKYLNAFAEVNDPTILDANSNVSVGFTQPLYTIADNLRQTTAYSYLRLVKDNTNLAVSKNTVVNKVIIEDKVAVGVEATYNDKQYTLKANKEVILSAGVFNTPQILMLSGIGPASHLESFDIPVILDLPVGDNLQDQVGVHLVNKMETSIIPAISLPIPTQVPFPIIVGSTPLNKSQTYSDYQTFNLILPHDYPYLILTCSVIFGYRDDICDRLNTESTFRNVLYSLLSHLQPKSRGTVRLATTKAKDAPNITTSYYRNSQDLEDMIDFVLDYLKVQESGYFKKVNSELAGLDLPECQDYTKGTREFWKCYILNNSVSLYHQSGTCSMGAVVDSDLLVLGVKKLRVVDASVMPTIPRSAPLPAVVMVAEKAAGIISGTSV